MKLSDQDAETVRKKPLIFAKHFYVREVSRINYQRIRIVWENGEIHREGKNKFRVVMKFGNKIVYIIFYSHRDYNELVTVGITSG